MNGAPGRRIVQIFLEQHGNKTTYSIRPVDKKSMRANHDEAFISCIYWKEDDDFFITAEDLRYLLEFSTGNQQPKLDERERNYYERLCSSIVNKNDTKKFFRLLHEFQHPNPLHPGVRHTGLFRWKKIPDLLCWIAWYHASTSPEYKADDLNLNDYSHTFIQASPLREDPYNFSISGDLVTITKS